MWIRTLELEFLRTLTCFLVILFAEVPVLVLGVQHFIVAVIAII